MRDFEPQRRKIICHVDLLVMWEGLFHSPHLGASMSLNPCVKSSLLLISCSESAGHHDQLFCKIFSLNQNGRTVMLRGSWRPLRAWRRQGGITQNRLLNADSSTIFAVKQTHKGSSQPLSLNHCILLTGSQDWYPCAEGI